MAVSDDYADRFVLLRGGLTVPAEAYLLLLELEQRTFTVTRDGDTLIVRPPDRLTRQDVARIKRWKFHLLLLLDYVARPDLDAHLFTDRRSNEASLA
jgi:hypothetical protein